MYGGVQRAVLKAIFLFYFYYFFVLSPLRAPKRRYHLLNSTVRGSPLISLP